MKKEILLIIYCCVCIFSSAQKKVIIDGREESIYLLHSPVTSDPAGAADLQQLLGSKKIVGLGEATHGTREFYQLKTELLQFLITRCGFRSVVFEGPVGGLLHINDYVLTGAGNIDSLLQRTGYWMYYTPEIRSFFTWLQAYNTGRPATEKVSVFGMDMQSGQDITEYLIAKNRLLPKQQQQSFRSLISQASQPAELSATLILLNGWLDSNRALISRVYAPEMPALYALCLKNIDYATRAEKSGEYFRDSCMAANVSDLVNLTGHKTVVWAHNGHIGMYDSAVSYSSLRKPMGELLKKEFKEQYYPIGFLFSEGSFAALEKKKRDNDFYYPWLKAFELKPAAANRLAQLLSPVSDEAFFIDISASDHPLWKQYQKVYTVGATYTRKGNNTFYLTPAAVFKGLVFIRKTTAVSQLDDHFYIMK